MIFQEPIIEFIHIDMTFLTTDISSSNCGEEAAQGGDRCKGDGPHSKCIGCEDVAADIAGKQIHSSSGSSKTNKSTPKNVVGFDMTFDK